MEFLGNWKFWVSVVVVAVVVHIAMSKFSGLGGVGASS